MDDVRGTGSFLVGLIVGGLIGLVAGIMLAPQSGEETRTVLRERGIELRGRAEGLTDEGRIRLQEAIEEGKEAAARAKEELTRKLEAEKEAKAPRAKKAQAE